MTGSTDDRALASAPMAGPASSGDLVAQFRLDCQARGFAESTRKNYQYILKNFVDWLEEAGVPILEVDKWVMIRFITHMREERNCHYKTLKNYLAGISSFYEFLTYHDLVKFNPVIDVRKRYLHRFKHQDRPAQRKMISVTEMATLVSSITEPRDRAVMLLLAKTGIRRNELVDIDIDDIDWSNWSITLKSKAKRSNRVVYFDEETYFHLLSYWKRRQKMEGVGSQAFFINSRNQRLQRSGIYRLVTHWAKEQGLHDPSSKRTEDHFTPHCCRHWFTTVLRRAGMSREFIKELRGDVRGETIDIYDHIEHEELKKEYLRRMPRLGV